MVQNIIFKPRVQKFSTSFFKTKKLFFKKFREVTINAFLHNKWINLNEPMFTAFSDRIEILSRGELPTLQTLEGFLVATQYLLTKNCLKFFCN